MSQSLNYHRPVYVGETLHAEVKILALKADKPVCHLAFTVTNQDGDTVLDAEAWTYTLRPELERPAGAGDPPHPR